MKLIEIRKQTEEQQKHAEDMQIMQVIRQYKSAPKLNTIALCEQAIKDVEDSRNRLHHPERFAVEIDQVIQAARNKVNEYRQRLANIQNRIYRVDNLRDMNQIGNECAELDVVFQDTADYNNYQDIKAQINLLIDDLERLQNLENRIAQTDTIAKCYDALRMIANERGHLHNVNRFHKKISDAEANLRQKIQDYTAELREFENNLERLKTVKEAQILQEELLKKSARYANSDAEAECDAILLELKLLIELLQIAESATLQTWTFCQAQIDRLRQWQNTTEGITEKLCDRLDSLCLNLEQQKARLLEQEQATARQWLQDLETQTTQITQLEDTEKLAAANNLLEKIQAEKNQYINLLTPEEIQTLENIERQCTAEQEKDKVNKIYVLFRQLPRLQKQIVYERLGQELANEVEYE